MFGFRFIGATLAFLAWCSSADLARGAGPGCLGGGCGTMGMNCSGNMGGCMPGTGVNAAMAQQMAFAHAMAQLQAMHMQQMHLQLQHMQRQLALLRNQGTMNPALMNGLTAKLARVAKGKALAAQR